ncbi:amidohydrolase family protein [Chitinophaga agrisoli]|uniref:Amidohydrolase family protein n=1 Tax=Chitinophaga agrisoli TaxID=2607653 RepID=A0A5B2VKT1_9BACT|nr:amidohydrolase family protein [Chitinophaga agrisoli]KAA2239424.1 amidohydrolase family protein [Chitinophaga agrisoli]
MGKILFAVLLLFTLPSMAQDLVISGAVVYASPQSQPLANAVVVVRNGKIAQVGKSGAVTIPPGIPLIDAHGMFLTAGYWNSHVHLIEPKWMGADTIPGARLTAQLDDMLNSRGFTHIFDLAEFNFDNLKALRARIDKGEVPGPAIRAVGIPFTPLNGSPFYIKPLKLPEIGDPASAARYVEEQISAGAQGIKIWSASPNGRMVVPMQIAVAKAAIRVAHEHHLPVFAHPTSDTGVAVAIASGVDVLAHTAPDEHHDWPPATIKALLKANIALIPTMKLFPWELLRMKVDTANNPLITTTLQQLGAFAKAGGTILFGTDVGYITDYSTEGEFAMMSRAGLDFRGILQSLTTAPAKKYGLDKTTGRIAPGLDADIVLLSADPALDSQNFAKVAYTIAKGKIIYRRP